jgi:hypothetical protein
MVDFLKTVASFSSEELEAVEADALIVNKSAGTGSPEKSIDDGH